MSTRQGSWKRLVYLALADWQQRSPVVTARSRSRFPPSTEGRRREGEEGNTRAKKKKKKKVRRRVPTGGETQVVDDGSRATLTKRQRRLKPNSNMAANNQQHLRSNVGYLVQYGSIHLCTDGSQRTHACAMPSCDTVQARQNAGTLPKREPSLK